MMTEREAWLKLAEWCDITHFGEPALFGPLTRRHSGVCMAVSDLWITRRISDGTRDRMRERLDDLPDLKDSAYKWPHTPEGHAQRAAFCREQAALLEGATT